jgi:hypothetical protein
MGRYLKARNHSAYSGRRPAPRTVRGFDRAVADLPITDGLAAHDQPRPVGANCTASFATTVSAVEYSGNGPVNAPNAADIDVHNSIEVFEGGGRMKCRCARACVRHSASNTSPAHPSDSPPADNNTAVIDCALSTSGSVDMPWSGFMASIVDYRDDSGELFARRDSHAQTGGVGHLIRHDPG